MNEKFRFSLSHMQNVQKKRRNAEAPSKATIIAYLVTKRLLVCYVSFGADNCFDDDDDDTTSVGQKYKKKHTRNTEKRIIKLFIKNFIAFGYV